MIHTYSLRYNSRIAVCLLLLVCMCRPVTATTYYVSVTGNDSGPGTFADPWQTIQKAADVLMPGDTVFIRGGTYLESVAPQNSGTAGNVIVYSGYQDEEVIIDPNDTTLTGIAIVLADTLPLSYLHFRNLTLKNGGWAGLHARVNPAPKSHLSLYNLTIQNSYAGIYWRDGITDSEIRNCDISLNHHNIYILDAARNILIDSNYIHHTEWHIGADIFSDNIHFGVSAPPWGTNNVGITITNNEVAWSQQQGIEIFHCEDLIIRGNHCHHNGSTGIQVESNPATSGLCERVVVEDNLSEYNVQRIPAEAGIWIDDANYVICQNNITRGNEMGLYITGTYNVIARFNEVYDNNHPDPSNINGYGLGVRSSPNDREAVNNAVVHNTVHNNSANSQRAQIVFGVWPPPTDQRVDSTRFYNNIASDGQADVDLWVQGTTNMMDHNCYYESDSLHVVRWQGSMLSWAGYVSASGQDANSINSNPLFTDTAMQDYTLQAGSPCIDAGRFLTLTTASGAGTTIQVEDAVYFSDGYGLIDGDEIAVGTNPVARVTAVDYETNTISVDQSLTWEAGTPVSYPYNGSTPDIGAHEYGMPSGVQIPRAKGKKLTVMPNPFNKTTAIHFSLPVRGRVSLILYDLTGRAVRQLLDGVLPRGNHVVPWDGRQEGGLPAGSGVYVCRLVYDGAILTHKVILVR